MPVSPGPKAVCMPTEVTCLRNQTRHPFVTLWTPTYSFQKYTYMLISKRMCTCARTGHAEIGVCCNAVDTMYQDVGEWVIEALVFGRDQQQNLTRKYPKYENTGFTKSVDIKTKNWASAWQFVGYSSIEGHAQLKEKIIGADWLTTQEGFPGINPTVLVVRLNKYAIAWTCLFLTAATCVLHHPQNEHRFESGFYPRYTI